MVLAAVLIALVSPPPSSSSWTAEKPAVRAAVLARHGSNTQIDSILIKGPYALVHGKGFHDGLKLANGKWTIVCDMSKAQVTAAALVQNCGFPIQVAQVVAADEPVNLLAAQGNFTSAVAAEQRTLGSASSPPSDTERARMQELRILNQQMATQQITRQQAIQQWSQAKFSWALP